MTTDPQTKGAESVSVELLDCPFCGKDALVHRVPGFGALHRVTCKYCDAGPHSAMSRDAAIAAWNTRLASPRNIEGDSRLREALEPFAKLAPYMAGKKQTVIGWNHDRVTYDDFRNAAAAVSVPEHPDHQSDGACLAAPGSKASPDAPADYRPAGYDPSRDAVPHRSVIEGWRPEVIAFARLMEQRLRANDHKPGWKNDDPVALAYRVEQELAELKEAMHQGLGAEAIGNEAADVANMTMMVADVSGALPTNLLNDFQHITDLYSQREQRRIGVAEARDLDAGLMPFDLACRFKRFFTEISHLSPNMGEDRDEYIALTRLLSETLLAPERPPADNVDALKKVYDTGVGVGRTLARAAGSDEITQADRNRAAPFMPMAVGGGRIGTEDLPRKTRAGEMDHHALVQAFKSHRLAGNAQ